MIVELQKPPIIRYVILGKGKSSTMPYPPLLFETLGNTTELYRFRIYRF